jgi:hypothetical protein
MLEEAGGNIDLAVRAYNTGIGRAMTEAGDQYLKGVMRRRARYLEGRPSRSPSWRFLLQERQMLRAAAALARRHAVPPPPPHLPAADRQSTRGSIILRRPRVTIRRDSCSRRWRGRGAIPG